MRKLNLDALDAVRHSVEKGGVSYAVSPITNRIAMLVDAAERAEGLEKIALYYDAVAKIVPTMPRADVDDLSLSQALAIIQLASEQVEAVREASDPNRASSTDAATPSSAAPTPT